MGAFSAVRLPALLSTSLSVPGTSSQQANALLSKHFGENIEGTFTVVLAAPHPSKATVATFDRRLAVAARAVPTGHASALQRGDNILYGDVGSSLGLQRAASYTDALRGALAAQRLPKAYVTGAPALQEDITPVLSADLHRGEVMAVAFSFVLLVLALGLSAAVVLPFLMALCTTAGALAIVYGLAHHFLMVLYIPNLVQLIGLGLAVDYSLLIVHRFRQEAADPGRSPQDAVAATMATAGRTVVISGVTVAIGLSVLLIIPVPFIRSLGVAGCLVPIMSVLAALTLQPALLSLLGGKRERGLAQGSASYGRSAREALWARLARLVMRRPVAVLAASSVFLAACALPVVWLRLTPASDAAIPQSMPSAKGIDLLRSDAGPGVFTPLEVVVDSGKAGGALTPTMDAATLRLAHELLSQPDVFVVAIGTRPPYVDTSARYRQTVVVERDDFGGEASQQLVRATQSRLIAEARFPRGSHVYLGGAPAQGTDFLDRVYDMFPWLVLAAAGISYTVLARAFRSVLLPLMAIALDAVSVAASYGLMVVLFRFGAGTSVLGLYHVSQIEGWVPVFLFAMLFGLSMDYEVFFVTRMRECWDGGADNREAVTQGLARTGRVVSVAAVIMVGALSGLVAGHVAGLQELGAGLALGVLLDATVVRGLLMPSLMALAGRWNWWLPAPVARALRVAASPPGHPEGEAADDVPELISQP